MTNLHNAHVERFRDMIIQMISDSGKERIGIRPRWVTNVLNDASMSDVLAAWDAECKTCEDEEQWEYEHHIHDQVLDGTRPFTDEWKPEPAPINNPFAALLAA